MSCSEVKQSLQTLKNKVLIQCVKANVNAMKGKTVEVWEAE